MPRQLPYSRVVDVVVSFKDQFPTIRALNTVLILQPVLKTGKVDATLRTKVYYDMEEVALDWSASDEAYKAALRFFQRTDGVGVRQLKIGYYNPATANIQTELDAIHAYDQNWLFLVHTKELNDTAKQRAIADWAEAKDVLFFGDSNDTDTETAAAVADVTGTVTISIAAPGVVTWTAHGLVADDPVVFTTSGALPTGIVAGTTYYVLSTGLTTNTFRISDTVGGTAVDTTGTQSGTHTATSPRYGGSIAEYVESVKYRHSKIFYHTDVNAYTAVSAAGYCAGRDFDRANFAEAAAGRIDSGQAYTLKGKAAPGVPALDKPSATVQAITGFVPGFGLDSSQGHIANTVINIGGRTFFVEGAGGDGSFIDEIHFGIWVKWRLQESILGVLLNADRIPYDNNGVAFICQTGIVPVMQGATAAGFVADIIGDDGKYQRAYQIIPERVENVTAARRRQRIAPDIKVRFRYAGAIHFVTVNVIVTF
jgi:hypothetical protein